MGSDAIGMTRATLCRLRNPSVFYADRQRWLIPPGTHTVGQILDILNKQAGWPKWFLTPLGAISFHHYEDPRQLSLISPTH